MADIAEQAAWEEGLYQIEDDDVSSGGVDGLFNIQPRTLGNRTRWLRRLVQSQTQSYQLVDEDGDQHEQVLIPRFRVPAGSLGAGVPSRDLLLGGFLVDRFLNQLIEGKAYSVPGPKPTAFVTPPDWSVASSRVIRGMPSAIMGVVEWGHLAWLIHALGRRNLIRGNNNGGKDIRDPAEFEYYGDPGYGPNGNGMGPDSWAHNGLATGVRDLAGNLEHLLEDRVAYGCLTIRRRAVLADDLDAVDGDFVLEDETGKWPPHQAFQRWPAAGGMLYLSYFDQEFSRIYVERMVYQDLVPIQNDPQLSTVVGVQRGAYGTNPREWPAGTEVWCMQYHQIVPDSMTCVVMNAALNNADPGDVAIAWAMERYSHGRRDVHAPAPGDVFACDNEDLLVVSADAGSVVVTRGHNGTAITAHPVGSVLVKYPAAAVAERMEQGVVRTFAVGGVHTHEDLEEMYLPAEFTLNPDLNAQHQEITYDLRWLPLLFRGGAWSANRPITMLAMAVKEPPLVGVDLFGLRCVLRSDKPHWGGV